VPDKLGETASVCVRDHTWTIRALLSFARDFLLARGIPLARPPARQSAPEPPPQSHFSWLPDTKAEGRYRGIISFLQI
jgi:hypothetical protein